MTVRELISELETLDDDAEVRLASQPQWPFEWSIQTVAGFDEGDRRYTSLDPEEGTWDVHEDGDGESPDTIKSGLACEEDAERWIAENSADPVVYIYEGEQLGYLPAAARQGWR